MKVLLLNGSPHKRGCTYTALEEVGKALQEEGIDTELIYVCKEPIIGCTGCRRCKTEGRCVYNDIVNEVAEKIKVCDGIVVGSPVYHASANGSLVAFLDRLFFSTTAFDKTMIVAASVVSARRGGCSATFDELNKYFLLSGMPVSASQYWNSVHGMTPDEVRKDVEGLQTMRTLGRNMAFLMKSIALGKAQYGMPRKELWKKTNFIRE